MSSWIIFVVIAVVGWLFNQMGEKAKKQKRHTVQAGPLAKKEHPYKVQTGKKRGSIEVKGFEEKRPETYAIAEKTNSDNVYYRKKAQAEQIKLEPGQNREDSERTVLDKESVLNGLIMSEILGPPRSKKPHRR